MKTKGLEINGPLKWALYLSLGMLTASGIAWLIAYYLLATTTDYGVTPSPWQPWSLMIHGAFAPVFLVIFGMLIPTHISRAFKTRLNLTSAMLLLAGLAALVVSGYLLYYCGDESLRSLSSVTHSSIGLLIVPTLTFHVIRGKAVMARNRSGEAD